MLKPSLCCRRSIIWPMSQYSLRTSALTGSIARVCDVRMCSLTSLSSCGNPMGSVGGGFGDEGCFFAM